MYALVRFYHVEYAKECPVVDGMWCDVLRNPNLTKSNMPGLPLVDFSCDGCTNDYLDTIIKKISEVSFVLDLLI